MTLKLLSPAETAEMLGVKEQTLRVWRCTKRYGLPWIQVGRKIMYRPEHVQRFLEERTQHSSH